MRAHGRVVGILGGTADGPTEYRAGDLKVVEAIAALAAPALDHALVHEAAVREATARERALEARVAQLEGGDAAG
jgi:GAF domain-containing protein